MKRKQTILFFGQHSLTVERPSYLWSDFVNLWRHACLVVYIYLRFIYAFASIVHSDLSDDPLGDGLFRGLVLLFRSSLDWFNQEDATASVWKWCFNVSPRSSLLAHREGPFSGCYWVTSLEWPRMEWITQTSKENSNEPMPHLTTFQNIGGNNRKLSIRQCLSLSNNNECLQQQHCRTTTLLQYPTLIYMIQKNRYKYGGSIINKCLR